jgi:hypothetical protein
MKKILSLIAVLAVTASVAHSQAYINFANGGAGVNSPIYDIDGTTPLQGSGFEAILWVDQGSGLAPIAGSNAAFSDAAAGYFFGGSVAVPGLAAGTYDVAVQAINLSSGEFGVSETFSANFVVAPTPANNLTGLTSFQLEAVPEPSTIAMIALGLGAVALRFRRK